MGKQRKKTVEDVINGIKAKRPKPQTKSSSDQYPDYYESGVLEPGRVSPDRPDLTDEYTQQPIDEGQVAGTGPAIKPEPIPDRVNRAFGVTPNDPFKQKGSIVNTFIDNYLDKAEADVSSTEDLAEMLDVQPSIHQPESPEKQENIDQGKKQEEVTRRVQKELDEGDIQEEDVEDRFQHLMKQPTYDEQWNRNYWSARTYAYDSGKQPKQEQDATRFDKTLMNKDVLDEVAKIPANQYVYSPAEGKMVPGRNLGAGERGLYSGAAMVAAIPEEMGLVSNSLAIFSAKAAMDAVKDVPDDQYVQVPRKPGQGGIPLPPRKVTAGQIREESQKIIDENTKQGLERYRGALEKLEMYEAGSKVPKTFSEATKDLHNFGEFAKYTIGQTAPQVLMAIGTLGLGTFAMETGIIQMEMMDRLTQEQGLTPKQILETAASNPGAAILGGLVSGATDLISLGVIAKATGLDKVAKNLFKQAGKQLAKKKTKGQILKELSKGVAISTGAEAIQEPTQGLIESVSAAYGIGEKPLSGWTPEDFKTEALAGGIMGVSMFGAGKVARYGIEKTKEAVKKKAPPIEAYHGTAEEFEEFDFEKGGSGFGAQKFGKGVYVTTSREDADKYRRKAVNSKTGQQATDKDGKIVEMTIDVKNPIDAKSEEFEILRAEHGDDAELTEAIKERGYDGVVYKKTGKNASDNYVVFDKEQITYKKVKEPKTVTETEGTVVGSSSEEEVTEEPKVTRSKDNPVVVRITDSLQKMAEENDSSEARDLLDEVDGLDEVPDSWIDDADKLLSEQKKKEEEESKPTEISVDMVIELLDLGYNKDAQDELTPEKAQQIIDNKERYDPLKRKGSRKQLVSQPIAAIETDTKRFQGRIDDYSEESSSGIVDAVKKGEFNIQKFDQIRLWKDPEKNRTYVLAGHSRLNAWKTLAEFGFENLSKEAQENLQKQGIESFDAIDAEYMEGMSEQEAIDFATTESNALGKTETDLGIANQIRKRRLEGMSENKLRETFKNYADVTGKILLSHLNPSGKAHDALRALERSNTKDERLSQVGKFLGHTRKLFPQLTDSHENELYEFLTDGAGQKITQRDDFVNRVENIVSRLDFKADEPLNIKKLPTMGENESAVRGEIDVKRKRRSQAQKELDQATGQEKTEELKREIANLDKDIIRLNQKIQEAKRSDRAQGDLFGGELPKPEAPPESTKQPTDSEAVPEETPFETPFEKALRENDKVKPELKTKDIAKYEVGVSDKVANKWDEDQFEIWTTDDSHVVGKISNADFPQEHGKVATRGEILMLEAKDKGKGIGQSLFEDAINVMRQNGAKTVKLTSPSKEGRAFNIRMQEKGILGKIVKVNMETDGPRKGKGGTTEYEIPNDKQELIDLIKDFGQASEGNILFPVPDEYVDELRSLAEQAKANGQNKLSTGLQYILKNGEKQAIDEEYMKNVRARVKSPQAKPTLTPISDPKLREGLQAVIDQYREAELTNTIPVLENILESGFLGTYTEETLTFHQEQLEKALVKAKKKAAEPLPPLTNQQIFGDKYVEEDFDGIEDFFDDFKQLNAWKRANPQHADKFPQDYVIDPKKSEFNIAHLHRLANQNKRRISEHKQFNPVQHEYEKYEAAERINFNKELIEGITGEEFKVNVQRREEPPKPEKKKKEEPQKPQYPIFDAREDERGTITAPKSEQLKTEADELKNQLLDQLKKFGDTGNKLMSGVDPEQIKQAAEIIATASKLGYKKFQQLVAFIEENIPGWLDDNYNALQTAYVSAKVSLQQFDESLDEIGKKRKEDAITEGKNLNRDAGSGTEATQTTEGEGGTEQVSGTEEGPTDRPGVVDDEAGAESGPSEGDGDAGSDILPTGNESGDTDGVVEERRDHENYVIPESYEAPTTFNVKRNLNNNIEALRVLRNLKEDGDRNATPDEQDILAKYVGWGGIKAIAIRDYEWKRTASWGRNRISEADRALEPYIEQVKALVKEIYPETHEDVMSNIRASILNAHYTQIPAIRGIYKTLEKWGMGSNMKVLEPSAGVGNFIGAMPQGIRKGANVTMVELDTITSDIADKLYPKAKVKKSGLQEANLPQGYYDLVISNIPFGDYKVHDKAFSSGTIAQKRSQGKIHNYFFAKGLDLTRPGGVVAFITSAGVLDSPSNEFLRKHIAKEAEFLGAVKLPSSTFKGNAGTEVTTDLIFLRKYNEGETAKEGDFITTKKHFGDNGGSYNLNDYWSKNPDNMLGIIASGGMYGRDGYALEGQASGIEEAIPRIMGNAMEYSKPKSVATDKEAFVDAYDPDTYTRPGNIVVHKGKVGAYDQGKFIELPGLGVDIDKVIDLMSIRGALNKLILNEKSDKSDSELTQMREQLNESYDSFVEKHGRIASRKNWKWISEDIDGYNLVSLEVYDTKTEKFLQKADIFHKRTINSSAKAKTADSPKSAALISLNETGSISFERIATLLQTDVETAKEMLKGTVFELPTGGYEIAEHYLSGNVKKKLKLAEAAAEVDEKFNENIEHLKNVIPEDVPISNIAPNLGARWIDAKYYTQFLSEEMEMYPGDVSIYLGAKKGVATGYNDQYHVEIKYTSPKLDAAGTGKMNGKQIFIAALNDKYPTIKKTIRDPATGKETTVKDEAATTSARLAIDKIKDDFENWVRDHEQVGPEIQETYNELFNTTVKGTFDGSFLTFPGYAGPTPRQHQRDAVAKIVANNGGVIDHIVGAGKTLVMLMASQELKRQGIAKKPALIVKKATLPNILAEAHSAYPAARILAPQEGDFSEKRRQAFLAKIANNDWDLVIMTHDNMKTIPPSPEVVSDVLRDEIEKLELDVEALNDQGTSWSKRQAKELEKRIKNLTAQIEESANKGKDKGTRTFDEMGLDHLFVDESHTFKNLMYSTRHGDVAGLSRPVGSDMANFLMFNIRHIQKLNKGDKGATFLSGTMITNSMVELYSILNFLRPNKLKELGIQNFDAWASVFARQTSEYEFGVEGTPKEKVRFSKFKNIPELSMLYAEIADVRNDHNLELPKPKMNKQLVEVPQSNALKKFTKRIIKFAKTGDFNILGVKGEATEGRAKAKMLVAINYAAQAAIDLRMLFKEAPEQRESKLRVVSDNVFDIWEQTKEYKGTQLIFLDLQNASKTADDTNKFNSHEAIRDKLVEYGVPKEEIIIMSKLSNKARENAFEKMRNGEARVMIGHKTTMGTGVNVQDKGVALHHVDLAWNPAPHQQADGRYVRQGNVIAKEHLDNVVPSYYYGTENSLDVVKFDKQKTKAQFIEQFTEGTVTEREIAEESENSEDLGTFLAALTGNTSIIDLGKVEQKIKQISAEKRNFTQSQHSAKENKRVKETQIETANRLIPRFEKDKAHLAENTELDEDGKAQFEVTTKDGTKYTKPKEFGEWMFGRLQEIYPNIKSGESLEIGEIHGFKINVVQREVSSGQPYRLYWNISGPGDIKYSWGGRDGFVAGDKGTDEMFTKLGKFPLGSFAQMEKLYKDNLDLKESGAKYIAQQDEIINKTWDKDEELRNLKVERDNLKEEIAKYDIDEGLGDLSGDLFEDEDAPLMMAKSGKKRKGKSGQSLSSYVKRKVTPEEKKQIQRSTEIPWKVSIKLLNLATKWAPDSPIGQGGTARGSIGTFFPIGKHLRALGLNDFDVFIHELMHAIDDRFGIYKKIRDASTHGAEIRRRLTDIYEEFYPGAKREHSLKTRIMEGMAVLVQRMATDPKDTKLKYGDLVAQLFTKGGEFTFNGAEEYAQDVEKLVLEYQQLSGLDKAGSNVLSEQPNRKRKSLVGKGVKFAETHFDDLATIEDLMKRIGKFFTSEDLASWIRYISNSYAWANQNVAGNHKEFWAFNEKQEMSKKYDYNYKTITESLDDKGLLSDFGYWLYGRRIHGDHQKKNRLIKYRDSELKPAIKSLKEQLKQEGLTALQEAKLTERLMSLEFELEQVEQEIARIEDIIQNEGVSEIDAEAAYKEGLKLFKKEGQMVDELMHEDLKLLRLSGLIDDVGYSRMAENVGTYAPFKRIWFDEAIGSEDTDIPIIKGAGKTKVASTLYRGGSTKPALDPFIGAKLNHADIMQKATRQMMYNKMIPMMEALPEWFKPVQYYPGIEKVDGIIIGRTPEGKRVPMQPHKDIMKVIDDHFTPENAKGIASAFLMSASIFRAGTTGLHIPFVINNIFLDQLSALVNTKNNFRPFIDPIWNGITGGIPAWLNWKIKGWTGTAVAIPESEDMKYFQEYAFLGGQTHTFAQSHMGGGTIKQQISFDDFKIAKGAYNTVAFLGVTSEMATRSAEYIKARKNGHDQFVALEMAGRVSTPFHHIGTKPLYAGKTYVRTVAYSNAAMQVLHQMYRTAIESREGRIRLVGVTAGLATAGLLSVWALLDDEEYKEQLEILKSQDAETLSKYLFVPYGNDLWKVRVPENYSWLMGIVNMAVLENAGETKYTIPEYMDTGTSWIPTQLNPFELEQWFISMIPSGLPKATLEVLNNRKTYPEIRDIVGPWELGKKPSEQYSRFSSPVAKKLGKIMNISPKKIDHLITGGFGRAWKPAMGNLYDWNWKRQFTRELYLQGSRQVLRYHDIRKEIDGEWKLYRNDKKGYKGDAKKLKSLMEILYGKTIIVDRSGRVTRVNRGDNQGIDDLLRTYNDLDLSENGEGADLERYRNAILNKIKKLENVYDQ